MSSSSSTTTATSCDCSSCRNPQLRCNRETVKRHAIATQIIHDYKITRGQPECKLCFSLLTTLVTFIKTFLTVGNRKVSRMDSLSTPQNSEFMRRFNLVLDTIRTDDCPSHHYTNSVNQKQLVVGPHRELPLCISHLKQFNSEAYSKYRAAAYLQRHGHIWSPKGKKLRHTISETCHDCNKLRQKINEDNPQRRYNMHCDTVTELKHSLNRLTTSVLDAEKLVKKQKKAKMAQDKRVEDMQQKHKETQDATPARKPPTDTLSFGNQFSDEEKNDHNTVTIHTTRKGLKPHATTKEAAVDGLLHAFNNHARFTMQQKGKSDQHMLCTPCLCTSFDNCNKVIAVDTLIRKLEITPSHISKKAVKLAQGTTKDDLIAERTSYVAKIKELNTKSTHLRRKLMRDINYPAMLAGNKTAVICPYCDYGFAVYDSDVTNIYMNDVRREQHSVRKCNNCDIVFCGMKNAEGKICGVRYKLDQPYGDDKDKADHTDHRRKTCEMIKALQKKDPNLIAIAKESRRCPNADCPWGAVQRKEGCNAMVCKCTEHFCWLCGTGFGSDNGSMDRRNQLARISHDHSKYCSGANDDYFHRPNDE